MQSAVPPGNARLVCMAFHHDQGELKNSVLWARAAGFGVNNRDAHGGEPTSTLTLFLMLLYSPPYLMRGRAAR